MIEEIIIRYLISQGIADGEIYAEAPVNPPAKYVLVQRSSESFENQLRHIGAYTESRSKNSKLEAARLHEEVIAAMRQMREHEPVFKCEMVAGYDAALTATKEYRFQALWEITM